MSDTSLLHDRIGGVPTEYLVIDSETPICNGRVPNVVVSPTTMSYESALVFLKYINYVWGVAAHAAASLTLLCA